MIEEELLAQEAARDQVTMTEEEIETLSVPGLSTTERERLVRRALAERLLEKHVRPIRQLEAAELDEGYLRWRDAGHGRLDTRVLFVSLPVSASPTDIHQLDLTLSEIALRVEAGEDFCDLVRRYASRGRDSCGVVALDENLTTEGQRALIESGGSNVVGPVRVAGGMAIFKRQKEEATASNSRASIAEFMSREIWAETRARWIARLRQQRGVRVDMAPLLTVPIRAHSALSTCGQPSQ